MTDADDPTSTMTDAEWAAEMSVHAMQRGRIELGYQLAKIAVQAQRHERARAAKGALFGDPEHSQPIPYVSAYTFDRLAQTHPVDVAGIVSTGPTGNGEADVPAIAVGKATPLCPAHGQPMLAGPAGPDGEVEWLCICSIGGRDLRPPAEQTPSEPPADAPTAQGRCVAEIVHLRGTERFNEPCRGAVYWAPDGSNRDNGTWRHVDPAIDAEHMPLI